MKKKIKMRILGTLSNAYVNVYDVYTLINNIAENESSNTKNKLIEIAGAIKQLSIKNNVETENICTEKV